MTEDFYFILIYFIFINLFYFINCLFYLPTFFVQYLLIYIIYLSYLSQSFGSERACLFDFVCRALLPFLVWLFFFL